MIAKEGSSKKRTVYQFNEYEMMSLRILTSPLHSYDYLFSPNLFSFRRHVSAPQAVKRLHRMPKLDRMWVYKADIHDYFNSIDPQLLLDELKTYIDDDRLLSLFETILLDKRVSFNGKVIEENKGVMAGIPISGFLANCYLIPLDRHFDSQDCRYMRYADDILILADSKDKLMESRKQLMDIIGRRGLTMNPDKEMFFSPGEKFEFLGFSISKDSIDLSDKAKRKIKNRMRSSARSIRKWMLRKNAPPRGTIRAYIRYYNHLLYGYKSGGLSWSMWYLPTVTTDESLREIDRYMQDWIRYIATGRHNKKNYDAVSYKMMKDCGYRPLVSQYYNNENMDDCSIIMVHRGMQHCICDWAKHMS